MKLVMFKANYADEFDVEGFNLYTDVEYEVFRDCLNNLEYPLEFWFGTNEEIVFGSKNQLLSRLVTYNISNEEGKTLQKIFRFPFGHWFEVEDYVDYVVYEESCKTHGIEL